MPILGYKDWQRVNVESGDSLVTLNQAVTATFAKTLIGLGGYQSLVFTMETPIGADLYQVQFTWFADEALTIAVTTDFITVSSNMACFMCVPVLTPFVVFRIVPKTGGNNTVITSDLYGSQQYSTPFQMSTFSTPIIQDVSAYAINETKQFFGFQVYNGRAQLSVNAPTAATGNSVLNYLDFGANAYKPYMTLPKLATGVPLNIEVPMLATQLRLDIVNGGTAQTITTALNALP